MRRRVMIAFDPVARHGNDLTGTIGDDGGHRHLTRLTRFSGKAERISHGIVAKHGPVHAKDNRIKLLAGLWSPP